jgi:Flp pilus assembly protein TadD
VTFSGEIVCFSGRLLTLTRRQAGELVVRHGGAVEAEPSSRATLVVVGADEPPSAVAPALANARLMAEDAFCERLGMVPPSTLRRQYYSRSTIRGLYPAVTDQHLRFMEKWGLLRSVVRTPGETWFPFSDVAVIREASDELARGASVQAVLRCLVAERAGQLSLDFQAGRSDAARVVRLPARDERRRFVDVAHEPSVDDNRAAEELFTAAARLDTGEPASRSAAMAAYRRALLLSPFLVPALVNLGNLHYAQDEFPEAYALYVQAASLDPDCLEAHFNLGNLLHDLGRFAEAEPSYREALRIDPGFADAHFYLAVALEKQRRSGEARPHWKRYQELAPDGEWVELAREFTE